jgi:tetratricopeptide (TPR) repeat protein
MLLSHKGARGGKLQQLVWEAAIALSLVIGLWLLWQSGALYRNLAGISLDRWFFGNHEDATFLRTADRYLRLAINAIPEDGVLRNRLERLDALRAYVASPSFFASRQARLMLSAGERCEQKGDTECALQNYQDALRLDSHSIPAYYHLYRLYALRGDHEQSQALLHALESLPPAYPLAKPAPVGDFALVGYDLDESSLEMGRSVEVVLHWQAEKAAATDFSESVQGDWHIYLLGKRLYQVGSVTNMATNGGFELTSTVYDQRPYGFTAERYDPEKYAAHRLVIANDTGAPTVCAELDNRRVVGGFSGYMSSESWPISADTPYLLGGRVRSAQQAGKIGLLWTGRGVPDDEQNRYVPASIDRNGWVYHAGVLEPPQAAVFLRLQLLNQVQDGVACFDNLFLIPIKPVQAH